MKLNYLIGLTAPRWRELRRRHRFDPEFRDRAAVLTGMSLINSLTARREARRFDDRIEATRVEAPPLFVLGHWRSGTTFLHNLLAQDPLLAYPTGYQVVFPHSFLTCEEWATRRFSSSGPKTRPMDNVPLSFESPQEEEHALAVLTLQSPYLGMLSFPREEARYSRYLTFRDAAPEERTQWKAALLWLARKLTLKYGDRSLVLKSPAHTARIALLLELFPDARFVHIHRNPYDVFRSTRHLLEVLPEFDYLQRPERPADVDGILRRYTEMYDAYFHDRKQIPEGRLYELRYESLEREPVQELQEVYRSLDLPGFEAMRPALEAYVASISGYRKNRHQPLEPALRERVRTAWQHSFDAWEYSPREE